MKIVSIESIDPSRTAIQIYLFLQRLKNEGIKVATSRASLSHAFMMKNIFSSSYSNWNVTLEPTVSSYLKTFHRDFYYLNKKGVDLLLVDHYILEQLALLKTNGYHLSQLLPYTQSLIKPDIEVVIDIPVASCLFQNESGETLLDCFREENISFMETFRENLVLLPEKYSSRSKYIIDGTMTIEEVHQEIYSIIKDNLLQLT